MPLIDLHIQNHIATLTMNDTKHHNCFTHAFSTHMQGLIHQAQQSHARVLIFKAQDNARIFSAGHDIHDFPTDNKTDPLTWDDSYAKLARAVRDSPLPTIAQVQGSVWGAGADFTACCDFIIATPDVTFAITPAKLGIPHHLTGIQNFMRSFPDHMLKEIFLLAKPITAETAHRFGFVNRIVPPQDLNQTTLGFAQQLLSIAPHCVTALKTEIRFFQDSAPLTAEQSDQIATLRRRAYTSPDYLEGLAAFFEKRPPKYTDI